MRRVFIILCCCLLFAGCGGEPPAEPTPAPETPAPETAPVADTGPRDGGTLYLSMRAPFTLNPLLNEDATVDRVLKLIFEPVAVLDGALKPTGNLAEMNFATDYMSVTLNIRGDAIWSDGTPVTAGDFVFSIETLKNAPDSVIYKPSVGNIASCEALDDKTVRVDFVEVFGGSAYLFDFPVIPRHYYAGETDPSGERNMNPLGNGLFIFNAYTPLKNVTLIQSPYTFRKRAYIERVEAFIMPDAQAEMYAFDQGLTDVLPMPLTDWSKHQSVKQTREGEYDAMYFEYIGFNFNNEVLRNKSFREALACALDIDALLSSIYLSHAVRAYAPVNPVSWVYEPDLPVYNYDEEMAQALVNLVLSEMSRNAAADVGDGEDGGETAPAYEFPVFRVLVNEENDERIKTAEALAEAMRQLGLSVELVKEPFEIFAGLITSGDYDIFVGGYNLSVIPDLSFAFHSGNIASGGNILSYNNPALDHLLITAFSAGTENAYQKAMSDVQRHIAAELPVISLAFKKSAILTGARVYGELNPRADNVLANVNEWYILE